MECNVVEHLAASTFVLAVIATNIAGWKMGKNTFQPLGSIPKWKLLFGDLTLPNNVLTLKGKRWRATSIFSFILLVVSGIYIAFSNIPPSLCFLPI